MIDNRAEKILMGARFGEFLIGRRQRVLVAIDRDRWRTETRVLTG
jgi:hypothetical protein